MGSTVQVLIALLCLDLLQTGLGFVRPEGPTQPPEPPTKGEIRNVSLHHLSSGYLQHLYPDTVNFLKISNSMIEMIDRDAFDHMTHLNLLEISDDEVDAPLDPQTFSRLPGLEILVLRNVGLRRPRLDLTNVQELILAQNEIETLDDGIVAPNLNFLDVSGNKLKGLNGSFAIMRKLSMIDVSRNKITEVSSAFQENVNLLTILASENSLNSTDGLRLPWLKTLDLFANKIKNLTSDSFRGMKSLQELILAFNDIVRVDNAFQDLFELKYLNLAWNYIEELDAGVFARNPYLTRLSLQGNMIRSLKKFRGVLGHLTHLDLSHNQLHSIDDDFFDSTPGLQVLDLSFNRLTILRDALSPLKELQVLNLAFNRLRMSGSELSTNRHLRSVNLSSNALEWGVSLFQNNPQLKNLDLSDNNIFVFCDGDLPDFEKVNLRGNKIVDLSCLKKAKSLCEVDFRQNPLTCEKFLEGLVLTLAKRKVSPYKLSELANGQCENLSLNQSFSLWSSVMREVCPDERVVELEEKTEEAKSVEEIEEKNQTTPPRGAPQKIFVHLPLGWIRNDEMNKPNPLETSQSGRVSWGNIEENSELLKGFEDEEVEKKPRFSWYTIALILLGLSLTLTCFNLVVFLYIRLKVWKRGEGSSRDRVYSSLPNEVYKHTTEPTKVEETEWSVEDETNRRMFYRKFNEVFINYFLTKKDKDSESAKNILINPTRQ